MSSGVAIGGPGARPLGLRRGWVIMSRKGVLAGLHQSGFGVFVVLLQGRPAHFGLGTGVRGRDGLLELLEAAAEHLDASAGLGGTRVLRMGFVEAREGVERGLV